jgi:hypothetical protein
MTSGMSSPRSVRHQRQGAISSLRARATTAIRRHPAAFRAHTGPEPNCAVSAVRSIEPPAIEKALPELGTRRQTVAQCLERPGALKPWELGFLRDLPGFRRLSTKQRCVLKEIADRVLAREAAQ